MQSLSRQGSYHSSDKPADVEGQFLADVAQRRWPVLIFIFCFDVFCYILRLGARLVANVRYGIVELAAEMGPQLANMGFCYLFLGLVNARSRRGGDIASRQVNGVLAFARLQDSICRDRRRLHHDSSQPSCMFAGVCAD